MTDELATIRIAQDPVDPRLFLVEVDGVDVSAKVQALTIDLAAHDRPRVTLEYGCDLASFEGRVEVRHLCPQPDEVTEGGQGGDYESTPDLAALIDDPPEAAGPLFVVDLDARRAIDQARKVVAIWRSVEDLAKDGQAPAVPGLLRGQLRLLGEILEGRR